MSGTKRYLELLSGLSDAAESSKQPPIAKAEGPPADTSPRLSSDEVSLVQIVYEEFVSTGEWPVFDFVERRLRPLGIDAQRTTAKSVKVGTPPYGPIWTQTMGGMLRPESLVGATLAGLVHLPEAATTVDDCLRVMRGLGQRWHALPVSSRQPTSLVVRWVDVAQLIGRGEHPAVAQVNAVIRLLEHEPPTWGGTNLGSEPSDRQWTVPRSIAAFEGVHSLREYFDQVFSLLTPSQPNRAAGVRADLSGRPPPWAQSSGGLPRYSSGMPSLSRDIEVEVLRAIADLEARNPPGRGSSVEEVADALGMDRDGAIRAVLALIDAHQVKGKPLPGDDRIMSINGIGLLPAGRNTLRPPAPEQIAIGGVTGEAVDRSMAQTVFIVHGHDGTTKAEAARTVQLLTGKNPVILHEKPNKGQTLIEKFEGHAAEAGYVVVLATADDVGRSKGVDTDSPRARQNVVFEWGFFVGALGRQKVAVLYEQGVELPSDILGVAYIQLTSGTDWKYELAREMRSAGVPADTNML